MQTKEKDRKWTFKCKDGVHRSFDDSSFDNIKNDLDAYTLGMFFSNGYILKQNKKASVCGFCNKNKKKVNKINGFFCTSKNKKISEHYLGDKTYYETRFCSKNLYKKLEQSGMKENKRNHLFPPKINKDKYMAFLAGYLEQKTFMKNNKVYINIYSQRFLRWIEEILRKNNIKYKVETPATRIVGSYIVISRKREIIKFKNKIYKNLNMPESFLTIPI